MNKMIKKLLSFILIFAVCFSFSACSLLGGNNDGKSAYELAVEQGYVGTVDEWIASLKGQDGEVGETGATGATGSRGLTGVKGDTGDTGLDNLYNCYTNYETETGYSGSFVEFCRAVLKTSGSITDLLEETKTVVVNAAECACVQVVSVYSSLGSCSSSTGVIYKMDTELNEVLIITNYHAVYNSSYQSSTGISGISDKIYVYLYLQEYDTYETLYQGQYVSYPYYDIPSKKVATYIGGSMDYDIAVLRVTGDDATAILSSHAKAASIAEFNDITDGQTVYAIGNADAEGIQTTSGIVSKAYETIEMEKQDGSKIEGTNTVELVESREIQFDAAVNHGNSGGGLFNAYGELIGIVNARNDDSSVHEFNYAIPISVAIRVADQVISNYKATSTVSTGITRGVLGITVSKSKTIVTDPLTGFASSDDILTVSAITPGSAADGKLVVNDTILGYYVGEDVVSINDFYNLEDFLISVSSGESLSLSIKRSEETTKITIESMNVINVD